MMIIMENNKNEDNIIEILLRRKFVKNSFVYGYFILTRKGKKYCKKKNIKYKKYKYVR